MNIACNFNNTALFVKETREKLGLGRTDFANLLGMGSAGERTVRGWETGEHKPSLKKITDISLLEEKLYAIRKNAPFTDNRLCGDFKFIDLFAGIGGIRLPFQEVGGQCVFTSEWDKFAQKTYAANFGELPGGDITQISAKTIPDHDLLLAGFPCQTFSQAGLKKGFSDTRGTMFFEIQRILSEKRPKAFLLENVKQLRGHDKGRTLETILEILRGDHEQSIPNDIPMSEESRATISEKLNYWVDFKVLRARDFGVPQNRERIFIIGFNRDLFPAGTNFENEFEWPEETRIKTCVGDIMETSSNLDSKYTISNKLWDGHKRRKLEHQNKGNGFGYSLVNEQTEYTNTISARYYKDGSEILIDQSNVKKNPRKLTSRECARLQGFPENFIVDAVSQGQIYKQFGNSVCMKVIQALARKISPLVK
jgi:DNA (cytosine-5)-methyltransferase 1